MSTAWPQVVAWANTTLPALFGIKGFDGPPVTGDNPVNYLTVGWTNTGETAGELSFAESEDGLGMEEQGHVLMDLVANSGDTSFAAVRATVFGWCDLLRQVVRADQTLGGILSANATVSVTNGLIQNVANEQGIAQALVVTLEYTTLSWPS